MTGLIILIVVLVLLVIWFITVANKLAQAKMKAKTAFADMDVFLTKRYDLIPNVVSTVKGYAKHEKDTFEAVINARNSALNATDPNAKVEADNQLTQAMGKLFALAESYPELKANDNFKDLQKQLSDMEKEIAGSRQYYNATVKNYNYILVAIPDCIVAKILGYKEMKMFEANEEQRKNVKVEF